MLRPDEELIIGFWTVVRVLFVKLHSRIVIELIWEYWKAIVLLYMSD